MSEQGERTWRGMVHKRKRIVVSLGYISNILSAIGYAQVSISWMRNIKQFNILFPSIASVYAIKITYT